MKNYRDPWNEIVKKYSNYTTPCVPSNQDVFHIEEYLKEILKRNKNPSILILGCTGQYRKLFSKYSLKIDLVDITKAMYMYHPKFLNSFPRKEKFMLDNWLTMRLNKKYDLILGDFVVHQFPLKKVKMFLKNVSKHLKESGFFITRVCIQSKNMLSEKRLIKIYKDKKPSLQTVVELNWFYIHRVTINKRIGRSSNKAGFLAMKKAEKKYPFLREWNKLYEDNLPTGVKYWTVFPKSRYKECFEEFFKIKSVLRSKDYVDSKDCPTYVLVKR
jgi:hypothetical protein